MVEHADLFRKHFMSQPAMLGSAKFAALHKALVSSGTFLFVPRGVEIELPIEIFHWLRGENAVRVSTPASRHRRTGQSHRHRTFPLVSIGDRRGFACGVNDLIAGPGAKVTYVCAQNWGEQRSRPANEHDHGRSRCIR